MLLLLFNLGEERYAIDSSHILEIIPLVKLRPFSPAPAPVIGVFNYRSQIIPVVDLCRLIQNQPCHHYLSTRIMIIRYTQAQGNELMIGLMAEKVIDTLKQPEKPLNPQRQSPSTFPLLGTMIMHETGMIQQIAWDYLVGDLQNMGLPFGIS